MANIEQIGKVNLDLTYYPGRDMYCDGEVEDDLLRIVRDHAAEEYPRLIEEHGSWEALYHLSAQRENIVEWLPLDKGMKVLEIGSGCGAITGVIARKAGSVTCVDLSKKRSMINAYRHSDCDNIEIHVGNFQDVEPSLPVDYDCILFIGVFEYAKAYIGGDQPYEDFLKIARRHLKQDGRIVIAIENKFGLKYWAGCREDHLGSFFSGMEGYPDGGPVRTFTRNGLERIFENCGIEDYAFYYPYPDYKFMVSLYSDSYLPKIGELSNNLRNFDRDRLLLFDEKKAFDSILREGLFPLYSNSYLVVLGEKPNTCYVKYSNDRKAEYRIRTEILPADLPKPFIVRKYPLCPEAREHIRNIEAAYRKLKNRYAGGELLVNRCELVEEEEGEPCVELEYIQGVTLEELLDGCLERDDHEGFLALFRKYFALIDYRCDAPVVDFDLIFSNILLCTKDETKPFDALTNSVWTLIDYEWTFERQIDTRKLVFRALHCYQLEDVKRRKMDLDSVMRELGMGEEEAEKHREEEKAFQLYVTGGLASMAQMWTQLGRRFYEAEDLVERRRREEEQLRVQVFAFCNEDLTDDSMLQDGGSYVVEEQEDICHLTWNVNPQAVCVRIDPATRACVVRLKEAKWNGRELTCSGQDSALKVNGKMFLDENSFVFGTEDPQMVFDLQGQAFEEENVLEVSMERHLIDRKTVLDIEHVMNDMLELREQWRREEERRRCEEERRRCEEEQYAAMTRIQIFELMEQEYNPEEAVFADERDCLTEEEEGFVHLTWKVGSQVRCVRVDPAFAACIVWLKDVRWNGRELPCCGENSVLVTNGAELESGERIVFATEDPQLVFDLQGQEFEEENVLEVSMKRLLMDPKIALDMENTVKRGDAYEKLYKESCTGYPG